MWSDVSIRSGVPELVTDAIFAPSQAWYVRGATMGDRLVVVANVDGRVQAINDAGQRWDSGEIAYGEYPVIVQPLLGYWEVVWTHGPEMPGETGGKTCGRVLLDLDMHEVTRTVIPGRAVGTAQGALQFLNGAVVFTDDRRSIVCGPLTVFFPMTIGDWTIGHDGNAYRVVGWHAPSGQAYEVAPTHAQTASHLAIDDHGLPVVAVAQEPVLVPFADWHPIAAAADEPPAHVPTFAPFPCRVSVFDQPGTEPRGVFYTVGRDDLPAAVEAAKATRQVLLAYVDGLDYPLAWVPNVPGVEVIPTVMAYPHKTGDSMQPVRERALDIAATVLTLKSKYPRVAVVIAAYRQIRTLDPPLYNWPLQHVLDLQAAVWDACKACGVHDVLVFVWTRGNGKDGIVSRPEFGESLNRMLAAALPMPVPLPPTPRPNPEPTTPKPEPPHQEPPVPEKPDLDQFVNHAIPAWAERFTAEQGVAPGPKDVGHIVFRVLIEGGAPEVMVVAPRPSPYDYDAFLEECDALATVRTDSGGAPPGPSLIAFWGYQLLVDGKRWDDVVTDARTV